MGFQWSPNRMEVVLKAEKKIALLWKTEACETDFQKFSKMIWKTILSEGLSQINMLKRSYTVYGVS